MLDTSPNRIDSVLDRLKSKIRTYVVIEGVALVVCLLCLFFWIGYGMDVVYFALRRLELPRWFRIGYLLFGIVTLGLAVLMLFVFRLVRSFRAKALALVLERRFSGLNDRLVTAVEMSEQPPEQRSELHDLMLDRTVNEVTREADTLQLGDVFDKAPIRRATIAAVVLALATGVFFAANAEAVERWGNAFLGLDDVYWKRKTQLRLMVVSQPGDVVKDFRTADGKPTDGFPGVYKHPKGSDLTLLVIVPKEGLNSEGEPWEIPPVEAISVTHRQAGRGTGVGSVFEIDDETMRNELNARAIFRFSKGDVTADTKVWVRGGDFTNRNAYEIEVVEPPQLDAIELACDFPGYMQNTMDDVRQRVAGRSHRLPEETRFLFDATANKEIVGARVEFGRTELIVGPPKDDPSGPVEAKVVVRSEDGSRSDETNLPVELAERMLRDDRRGLRVPFVVTRGLTQPALDRAAEDFAFTETVEGLERTTRYGQPFVIAPGTRVRVYLSDTDGIETIDPTQVTIDAEEDRSPEFVNLALRAIGSHITRKATIPFEGSILDDYGLRKARFEFKVVRANPPEEAPAEEAAEAEAEEGGEPMPDEPEPPVEQDWRVRPFDNPPDDYPIEYHLKADEDTPFEKFEVLPLDLKEGRDKLILTIYAEDGDDLNGPHFTRTAQFEFEIVSESDLQALLYGREMDLLEQLQQVIDETTRTRIELEGFDEDGVTVVGAIEMADEYDKLVANPGDGERLAALRTQLEAIVRIGLDRTRTSAGECANIERSFEEIREELSNNGVDVRQIDRMREAVIDPLHRVNTRHFPDLDIAMGGFKVGVEDTETVGRDVQESIDHATELIEILERVRDELKDRVSYLRAVREIKQIMEQEQDLRKRTEDAQRDDLERRLGGGGDKPDEPSDEDLEKLKGLGGDD